MVLVTPNQTLPSAGLEFLPGRLPECEIPADADLESIAETLVEQLPNVPEGWFTKDALLRDQIALSGTFRTFYGGVRARANWLAMCKARKASNFSYIPKSASVQELGNGNRWILAGFTFETSAGLPALHSAFLNIVPHTMDPGSWQVWSLQTLLENFVGHEMVDLRKAYPDPERDIFPTALEGLAINRNLVDPPENFYELDKTVEAREQSQPRRADAIIVGGGQHGLCTAGYCKALGLDAIVIERNARIGDNWVLRYDSLYLHTTHRFNDLAFPPTFNEKEYGEWLTAAEMARGYQYYVKRFGINVWLSSSITSCTFDKEKMEWTMELTQNGQKKTIISPHLVLALGAGGTAPLIPHYPGQENFKGTVLHSSAWKSAKPWKGKKGIVVGTANTGHDVAENMLDAGLSSVTMLQRNRTYVIPRDFMTTFLNYAWLPHEQRSSDISDRLFWSPPTAALRLMCYNLFNPQFDAGPEQFDALEAVGFKCDRRGDFMDHLLVRFGGHFMDHGASAKISAGKIKVQGNASIAAFTSTGLELTDGTELDADLVVFATGFEKDMTPEAAKVVGPEVASQLDEFFGVDEEGEARGAFKYCGFPNIWMTGGGCAHARYFTRYVALQIKASTLGEPIEIYKETQLA